MDSRYLFRGKSLGTGEWITGSLSQFGFDNVKVTAIAENWLVTPPIGETNGKIDPLWEEVDPATVGRCAELKDVKGELIFEGDILITDICREPQTVKWRDGSFVLWSQELGHKGLVLRDFLGEAPEVVGNIYDNPELIEQEAQQEVEDE